jgi:hypothetical protein
MTEYQKVRMAHVRAWATDELHRWLTAPERLEKTREYMQEGAQAVLSNRVRLAESKTIEFPSGEARDTYGGAPNTSEALLSFAATRLHFTFSEDGDCYGDLGGWPHAAGYSVGLMVDYHDLAGRLLDQLVPEYVPDDVRPPSDGGPADLPAAD